MNSKILPILAIFSILLVAGCTSTGTIGSSPSVSIVSPTDGQAIAGDTVTVSLGASNVRLTAPNGTVVEGEGHFHVWIDDANEQRGAKTTFTFENAAAGTHTVRVELHKGDHSLYEGTAKTVTFTVSATGPVKEFNMSAQRFSFDPSTITVNKGDRVVLRITSTDVEHGFSLATYNIVETLPVGETKTISFTAEQVGEFNFFCSVFCGSGHGDMRGKLIVNP
ncbi:MAG: cupredoxin domain-containing protein [Candidatus Aenigmarchaeota archaeon]|nr:cupredoxin domain-containing protein [Candidatus Aenigmarchaeota archaeon]